MEGESDFRPWDELIPDVLGLIFRNLGLQGVLQVIPLVCKSWCKAVEGPYCWQYVNIDGWSSTFPYKLDQMLKTILPRSSGLLRMLSVSGVNDDQLLFLAEHAGSLQTLALRASSISDSIVEQVAPKFSSLTYLDLSNCCEISTLAVEAIGRNCKMLVSLIWKKIPLDLENSTSDGQSDADEARAIARTMPKLKHLSIPYHDITIPVIFEILWGCPELEWLDIQRGFDDVLYKFLEWKYPKVALSPSVWDEQDPYCWDPWDDYTGSDDSELQSHCARALEI